MDCSLDGLKCDHVLSAYVKRFKWILCLGGCFINTFALPTKLHRKVLKSQYRFLYRIRMVCCTASYVSDDELVDVLMDYVFPPHLPDQIFAV